MDDKLLKKFMCLSTKLKREIHNLETVKKTDDLSGTNGMIIGFIYQNKDKDIYQKDIEKNFGITRSTASNIISRMEEKGYIIKESKDGDLRLKKLVLTDKAIKYQDAVINDLNMLDNKIKDIYTKEELDELIYLIDKLEKKLGGVIDD